jgi:hypothetical protein
MGASLARGLGLGLYARTTDKIAWNGFPIRTEVSPAIASEIHRRILPTTTILLRPQSRNFAQQTPDDNTEKQTF